MEFAHILFLGLAALAVVAAFNVILQRNPIYSAIGLIVVLCSLAVLFLTLNAQFISAMQIIVYAGAILVLYLFVVLLLNIRREDRYHAQFPVAMLLGVMLLTELVLLALQRGWAQGTESGQRGASAADVGNTQMIGEVLYSTYLFPFEVASLVLLVAMIGAIILAKRDILPES